MPNHSGLDAEDAPILKSAECSMQQRDLNLDGKEGEEKGENDENEELLRSSATVIQDDVSRLNHHDPTQVSMVVETGALSVTEMRFPQSEATSIDASFPSVSTFSCETSPNEMGKSCSNCFADDLNSSALPHTSIESKKGIKCRHREHLQSLYEKRKLEEKERQRLQQRDKHRANKAREAVKRRADELLKRSQVKEESSIPDDSSHTLPQSRASLEHLGRLAKPKPSSEIIINVVDSNSSSPSKSVQSKSVFDRLTKVSCLSPSALASISDLTRWKRKHGIDDDAKIFVLLRNMPVLHDELIQRGWIPSPSPEDNHDFFDLKFVLKRRQIKYKQIRRGMQVNMLRNSSRIVTKIGLMNTLNNIRWVADVDINSFFPRCFELVPESVEEFRRDFIVTASVSILQQFFAGDRSLASLEVVDSAIRVCKHHLQNLMDMREEIPFDLPCAPSRDEEDSIWRAICDREEIHSIMIPTGDDNEDDEDDDNGGDDDEVGSDDSSSNASSDCENQRVQEIDDDWNDKGISPLSDHGEFPVAQASEGNIRENDSSQCAASQTISAEYFPRKEDESIKRNDSVSEEDLISEIPLVLRIMEEQSPQFTMNGTKNIWICKPGAMSRGRGIECSNNLDQILSNLKQNFVNKYVVQKYIERPLIIYRKKFDIRQWVVLHRSGIWMYENAYLRFCVQDFSLDDLSDRYIHLANNCVQKTHELFHQTDIEGNMWHTNRLSSYLLEAYETPLFETCVLPQIKDIIRWTFGSLTGDLDAPRTQFEFFGFDFIIDENFHVWLLEVNSSPDLSLSTPVTEELVPQMQPGLVRIVLEEIEFEPEYFDEFSSDGWLWIGPSPVHGAQQLVPSIGSSKITVSGSAWKYPKQARSKPKKEDDHQDHANNPKHLSKSSKPSSRSSPSHQLTRSRRLGRDTNVSVESSLCSSRTHRAYSSDLPMNHLDFRSSSGDGFENVAPDASLLKTSYLSVSSSAPRAMSPISIAYISTSPSSSSPPRVVESSSSKQFMNQSRSLSSLSPSSPVRLSGGSSRFTSPQHVTYDHEKACDFRNSALITSLFCVADSASLSADRKDGISRRRPNSIVSTSIQKDTDFDISLGSPTLVDSPSRAEKIFLSAERKRLANDVISPDRSSSTGRSIHPSNLGRYRPARRKTSFSNV